MKIEILCQNCKVHILDAEEEGLSSPLVGEMFRQPPGMEWDIFAPTDTGNDLICPMCNWTFHQDNKLLTPGGEFIPREGEQIEEERHETPEEVGTEQQAASPVKKPPVVYYKPKWEDVKSIGEKFVFKGDGRKSCNKT